MHVGEQFYIRCHLSAIIGLAYQKIARGYTMTEHANCIAIK